MHACNTESRHTVFAFINRINYPQHLLWAISTLLLLIIFILLVHTPIRIPQSPLIFISLDPAGASANALHPSSPPAAQQSLRNLTGGFLLGAH